jgi:hypothetical protein
MRSQISDKTPVFGKILVLGLCAAAMACGADASQTGGDTSETGTDIVDSGDGTIDDTALDLGDVAPDSAVDVLEDTAVDVAPDLGDDVRPDIGDDILPDIGEDTGTDVGDVAVDVPPNDGGPDVPPNDAGDPELDVPGDISTDVGTDIGTDVGSDVGTDAIDAGGPDTGTCAEGERNVLLVPGRYDSARVHLRRRRICLSTRPQPRVQHHLVLRRRSANTVRYDPPRVRLPLCRRGTERLLRVRRPGNLLRTPALHVRL